MTSAHVVPTPVVIARRTTIAVREVERYDSTMSRRSSVGVALLLLVTCCPTIPAIAQPTVGETPAPQDRPPRRPNVVFLLTDDHRFDALGCMGNPIIRTPNIDRLAAQGTLFRNAFVTTSICCTSRASVLTGQYATRHGVHDFATPFTPDQLRQTYPVLLRHAGYRTGFVGKFGVGDKTPLPADQFDYFKGFPGQGNYWPKNAGGQKHLTDVMTTQAIQFLRDCKPGQPFCLSVSYKAPHAQDPDPKQYLYAPRFAELYKDATIPVPPTATEAAFAAQPPFIRKSEARRRWELRFATPESYQEMIKSYYRLITHVDESVGQIVAALRDAGLDDNTVIVFTGDNGYYFGEHGLADKWFGHEESIRVPLIVRDPRLPTDQRGRARDAMALNIDLAPTMLSLAGVPIPPGVQGRDLTPLLAGNEVPWRSEFFYEHRFKHPGIPMSEGVRTGEYVYWRYLNVDRDAEWLFDLRRDPRQTRNLAADPALAAKLAVLRGTVESYRTSLGPPAPREAPVAR
jgi:arylsulfatase A-like enzyme